MEHASLPQYLRTVVPLMRRHSRASQCVRHDAFLVAANRINDRPNRSCGRIHEEVRDFRQGVSTRTVSFIEATLTTSPEQQINGCPARRGTDAGATRRAWVVARPFHPRFP